MGIFKNLSGQQFGRLTVTPEYRINKYTFWKCKCVCGNEKWVRQNYLVNRFKNHKELSCGCHRIKNIAGQRHGKLIVLDKYERRGKCTFWLCRCDCGNEKWIDQGNIKRRKSCGCEFKKNMRKKMMKAYGSATKNNVFCDYKKSAKYRKYSFNLDFDYFIKIIQKPCFYCGSLPFHVEKSKYNNGDFIYSGLDRINNDIGYKIGNVIPCCKICNKLKMDLDKDVFIEHIKNIYNHLKNK